MNKFSLIVKAQMKGYKIYNLQLKLSFMFSAATLRFLCQIQLFGWMDVVVDLVVLVCFIITLGHRTQDSWCVAGLL